MRRKKTKRTTYEALDDKEFGNFSLFSNEVLAYIFSFVDPKNLAALEQVCKNFYTTIETHKPHEMLAYQVADSLIKAGHLAKIKDTLENNKKWNKNQNPLLNIASQLQSLYKKNKEDGRSNSISGEAIKEYYRPLDTHQTRIDVLNLGIRANVKNLDNQPIREVFKDARLEVVRIIITVLSASIAIFLVGTAGSALLSSTTSVITYSFEAMVTLLFVAIAIALANNVPQK